MAPARLLTSLAQVGHVIIDFSKLGEESGSDTAIDPREIFFALPNKAPRYRYPRDVQGQVMDGWFGRRTERDIVVKMNTGAGKTVVGLLLLKSCLNEGMGPALYVAPDKYLVNQVLAEAQSLGLVVTEDVTSPAYLKGQAIAVINVYKLLNGLSAFGVAATGGTKVPIGSVVVDDAHACLTTAEDQFTLRADSGTAVYDGLLKLFSGDLKSQSETKALDIVTHVPNSNMLVPFWAWASKQSAVAKLLHQERESDELKFVWPLIKEVLPFCECSFGGGSVEITSRCLPIDAIPSFADAHRRIFMTATLSDDGVLVTHFDADPGAAERPVTPGSAADLGERMILIPQELNPSLSDEDLRGLAKDLSEDHNVVVIVPSHERAALWQKRADRIVDANGLWAAVEELKNGHVGLVVLVNKYDGVDLPDDACRLLVLDGLPDVRRKLDRIEALMLRGSSLQTTRLVQRLEQGMGRGTRSAEDHCAVILMGKSLTGTLYAPGALERLTPATRAQYRLSQKIGKLLTGASIDHIKDSINLLLNRDRPWVSAAKTALVGARYATTGTVGAIARAQRKALNHARRGNHVGAAEAMQTVVNAEPDGRTRGWLRMQLAERVHHFDAAQAQKILQAAIEENPGVLLPQAGVPYRKLKTTTTQSEAARARLAKRGTPLELMIEVNAILDRLQFIPETAFEFEHATQQLGELLGFEAQIPETEFGSGPDVLWQMSPSAFLVIECKNGVTNGIISKGDVNQLSGSVNWFRERYGQGAEVTPVMIHPDPNLGQAATAVPGMRVIERAGLEKLKDAVLNFASAAASGAWPPILTEVEASLSHHGLTAAALVSRYTSVVKKGK